MPDRNQYTVGWICAIPVELVAAKLFLDERHGKVEDQPLEDNNIYTLGKIGDHNVVVASLPDGEYGTEVAGTVARDLLRSFPNVKVGLMVGIGGGVPSTKHDIRLGDVVVSATRNGEPGVFQYDFGKTIQDGAFQHTRFLDQTPRLLRSAVAEVKSEYHIVGHRFNSTIDTILEKNRKVQKTHQRPPETTDRLYISSFVHPPDGAECEKGCGDDKSVLKLRPPRDEDEDDPAIHYGLIASGNSLMKDAKARDQLAEAKDVLCFEMEAAGLANHFPCLVVRGICDYADSHKKKEWQGYAAMTAAAYAKDVLNCIPVRQVQLETPIAKALDALANDVNELLEKTHERDRENILDWITLKDYGPEHSDRLEQRAKGTGQWFLDSKTFKLWLEGDGRTLFCPGIPGAGKTILASIVIDHIGSNLRDKPDVSLAYIYFDHKERDQHTIKALVASLLKQLAASHVVLPDTVRKLYKAYHYQRTRPTMDEYIHCLRATLDIRSRAFIVLDALDECTSASDEDEDRSLHKLLDVIFQLQVTRNVKLLATSRFIPNISKRFDTALVQEIRACSDDITSYVSAEIKQMGGKIEGDDELQEAIKNVIVEAVDGMFLMARLYIQSLRACMMTKRKVKEALERFARQQFASEINRTHRAYDEAVLRIDNQNKEYQMTARHALLWITYAERPLTTDELIHALAVERGKSSFDEDNMARIEDVVSVCAGLVALDDTSGIIRLVHHTAYEYFQETRSDWFPETESEIASLCVTYLSYEIFASYEHRSEYASYTDSSAGDYNCELESTASSRLAESHSLRRLTDSHCLYSYAATYWGHHARRVGASVVDTCMIKFLENARQVKASWITLLGSEHEKGRLCRKVNMEFTGIHLASYFGIEEAVRQLLINDANVSDEDGQGWTPISYAAYGGQEPMIRLLLAINPEMSQVRSLHALDVALSYEQEETALRLLERGANIGNDKWQAHLVYTSIIHCMHAALERLLSLGADPNDAYGTAFPLSMAALNGCEDCVTLLLDGGAQVNDFCEIYGTALNHAAAPGHASIVQLLLDHGADTELGCDGETPLMSAAREGRLKTVEILVEEQANIEAVPVSHWKATPLSQAAGRGHTDVARFLLDCGADIDAPNVARRTPLSFAAGWWYDHSSKLLLDRGANIQATDDGGNSPLHRAAEAGMKANIQLLIDYGANLEATNWHNSTPLHRAVENKHLEAVQLLLCCGANIDAVDHRLCGTSLCCSCFEHRLPLIRTLIERKADVNVTDCYGNTPLMCALSRLSRKTWNLLSKTPAGLPSYCRLGKLKIMKIIRLLADAGADVGIKNSLGNTALHFAACAGHMKAVSAVIRLGADINARNNLCRTALYDAGLELAESPRRLSHVWSRYRGFRRCLSPAILSYPPGISETSTTSSENNWQALASESDGAFDKRSEISDNRRSWHSEASCGSWYDSLVSFSDSEVYSYCPRSGEAEYGMPGMVLPFPPMRRITEVFSYLLAKGANMELADCTGVTLLWRLACAGQAELIRSLLHHGACTEATGPLGITTLHISAFRGDFEVSELLLAYEADIEVADAAQRTPLAVAASGSTPLQIAVMTGHDDVERILSLRGAYAEDCFGLRELFSEADDANIGQFALVTHKTSCGSYPAR